VVEIMDYKLKEFQSDEELMEIAFNRMVRLKTEESEKEEFKALGKAEGLAEGLVQGKAEGITETSINITTELVNDKYPGHILDWISRCTMNQLQFIRKHVYKTNNYEELLNLIHNDSIIHS